MSTNYWMTYAFLACATTLAARVYASDTAGDDEYPMDSEAPAVASKPVKPSWSEAEKKCARSYWLEGQRQQQAGQLRDALASFRKAHACIAAPTTRLSIAQVLARLGRLAEARTVAREVVAIPAYVGEPEVFVQARRKAGVLAERLEARMERALQPPQANPAPAEKVQSPTPALKPRTSVPTTPKQHPSVMPTSLAWAGFSIAAVGIIIGGGAGGVAMHQMSRIEQACSSAPQSCIAGHDDFRSTELWAHTSTAGFALAGVGAVTGLIGLFVTREPDDTAEPSSITATIQPSIGPIGAILSGTL